MEVKEIRKMSSEDVMDFCETRNYYTEGIKEDYIAMLISCDEIENVKLDDLQEIAENIFWNSAILYDTTPDEANEIIKLIMQQLVNECCTTYIV